VGYNNSQTVKRIFADLKNSIATRTHRTDTRSFAEVRYCLMLCAEILNARRAGDLTHSADADDHVVYVRRHKTATTALCPINFHGELFEHSKLYVAAYRDTFLAGEYLFPKLKIVGDLTRPVQMDESDVNRSFNRAWRQFRDQSGDSTLPFTINSRMVRHRAVSAVHSTDDPKERADAATAMSHSLHTA